MVQSIPGHGNEATEFFNMDGKSFLAVASIRSGPKAPYNLHAYSKLYQFDGKRFVPIQQFLGFASKNWKHFQIGKRHFLALANGVVLPGTKPAADTASMIYQWDGSQFKPFQKIDSSWAYQWEFFSIDGIYYLALADHLKQSIIYRWDGQSFQPFQSIKKSGGRAFKYLTIDNKHYLAYANISNPSMLLKWNGREFIDYQIFDGLGGRNFIYFKHDKQHYLQRINFITGSRTKPQTAMLSPLYHWKNGQFIPVQSVLTNGGVNAAVFTVDKQQYLAIANSLSKAVRFAVDSQIYRIG